MISALRRSKGAERGESRGDDAPFLAPVRACQGGVRWAVEQVAQLKQGVAAGWATATSPQAAAESCRPAFLLASVSGSAGEQGAYLPSWRRPSRRQPQNAVISGLGEAGASLAPDAERILISEVEVVGVDGQLKEVAQSALSCKPNFAYTIKEVQDDMKRVFDTGYFATCKPVAEDTRDGVKLAFQVSANPELRGFTLTGANSLPQAVVQDAFIGLHGRIMNFNRLAGAVRTLNQWYEDRGVLGQVIDVEMGPGNIADVKVAEAVVSRINLRYMDPKTGEVRDEGKTRPEVILRNLGTQTGEVYSLRQAKSDIEAIYSMGLFDDVSIRPQPAEGSTLEQPKVDLSLEIKERKTGGLSAGGGISASGATEGAMPGFIGQVSYSQRNLFGLGQRLVASAEIGQIDSTFRISHTDPWVRGDPYRTSRTTSVQNTKASAAPIHGRVPDEVDAAAADTAAAAAGGDGVFVSRVLGSVEYGRPLGTGWLGTLGLSWQRAKCVDEHSQPLEHDCYGGPLTFSGKQHDTMALGLIRVAFNSPAADSELVASMEQAVPLQSDWLNFNRLTLRAERSLPVGPVKLWVCGKGGMIVGDLPSYEAFPIGGTNSVRGYSEGGVGSGRNYVAGTVEAHVPLVSPLEATFFADYGSDLDSGASVRGDPAGARGKPGSGWGVGGGVRIDTPIGPLRLEYALNDRQQRRFHLGIGSHG